jgi:site-specific recombinase XerD
MIKFGNSTLFGMIHDYLKIYLPKQRKLSLNTIRSYRQTLEMLVDFIKETKQVPLGDVTFEMITADTILAYLDHLESERNCSISTRNNRLAAIRAFLKFAAARDVTTVVQLNELKKVPVKKPDAVEVISYMVMEAVTAITEQADDTTPKGLRDRFFMLLMYDTGARVQEMIDIRLCDIRISKTSTITLRGKGSKVRSVPLMDITVEYLKNYIGAFHENVPLMSDTPLFYTVIYGKTGKISASCIRLFLSKYAAAAREHCREVPENVHPHLWRHSRAMHLYQQGMDLTLLAQWLGHVHLETSLMYAHADTEHKRKAIAAATPPGNPLHEKLSPKRFTITDEEMLKRLTGLR